MSSSRTLLRVLGTIALLLFSHVHGQATTKKKERKQQKMRTGELPAQYIQRKIDTHEVMIFAKSYGANNHEAKSLLKTLAKETSASVEFLDLDLMEGWDGSLLMLELESMTGQWALPNIFIGGKHVGGNSNLEQLHALGDLKKMIREAGQEL